VAFGASLALGALVSVGLVAYGLPTTGSVAFGLSWAVFGWAFAAVAAVAAQVTESARVARGISIAVLGLSFVLRAAGDVGQEMARVLGAALVQLPAVWVLVGVAVALFGVLPRFMTFGGWAVLAACALIEEFGRPLQLSKRVLDLSPFAHVPRLPGGDISAASLLWLASIVVGLVMVGLLGFRSRDVQ